MESLLPTARRFAAARAFLPRLRVVFAAGMAPPGQGPNANLYWFEQPSDPFQEKWTRHHVVTQYSLNNLDVADMNGDGSPDIITAEHKGPDLKLQVWQNDGKGNFALTTVDRGKESHLGARVADLNRDGAMDIVSIGWDRYAYLHLWRNDGLSHPPQSGPGISWKHLSSARGDFPPPGVGDQAASLLLDIDKDGKDEIIIAGWGDTSSVWYKRNSDTWDRYLLDASKSPSIGGRIAPLRPTTRRTSPSGQTTRASNPSGSR